MESVSCAGHPCVAVSVLEYELVLFDNPGRWPDTWQSDILHWNSSKVQTDPGWFCEGVQVDWSWCKHNRLRTTENVRPVVSASQSYYSCLSPFKLKCILKMLCCMLSWPFHTTAGRHSTKGAVDTMLTCVKMLGEGSSSWPCLQETRPLLPYQLNPL